VSPSPDGRRARELFAALDSRLDDDPACQRRVVVALEKAMATPKSSNRRTPAVVDPFEVYRHDAHRLRPTLEDLDIERLTSIFGAVIELRLGLARVCLRLRDR